MTALESVLSAIDGLSPEELENVYRYVVQRRQPGYWLIPGENLKEIRDIMQPVYAQTDRMDEGEINAAIDEAARESRLSNL